MSQDIWEQFDRMRQSIDANARISREAADALMEGFNRLKAERDALAAHLHQIRHAFNRYDLADYCSDEEIEAESELYDLMEKSPETSLAHLKAEWQADLMEQARRVRNYSNPHDVFEAIPVAALEGELRRQAEELS